MTENFKTYPSYIALRESGMSNKKIKEEIELSRKSVICSIPDEYHYILLARLKGLQVANPNTKSKFIPASPSIQISDIKNMSNGTYVIIEGKIMTIFSDLKKSTLNITDLKKTIRCTLFDKSNLKFRNEKFKVGENIRLERLMIKYYKGIKECKGNEYTLVEKIGKRE